MVNKLNPCSGKPFCCWKSHEFCFSCSFVPSSNGNRSLDSTVVLQHEDQNSAVSSFRDPRGLLSEVVEGFNKKTRKPTFRTPETGKFFWIGVMAYHLHP